MKKLNGTLLSFLFLITTSCSNVNTNNVQIQSGLSDQATDPGKLFRNTASVSTHDSIPGEGNPREAFDLAVTYIRQAQSDDTLTNQERNALNAVIRVFQYGNFLFPPDGADFTPCMNNISLSAFTTFLRTLPLQMYMCNRSKSYSNRDLAQILIHEAAHKGYPTQDECVATYAELVIVSKGNGSTSRNGLNCNLEIKAEREMDGENFKKK